MTTKAFYLRTEFWVAVGASIIGIGNDGLGLNLPKEVVIALTSSLPAYIIARGWAKSGTTQ